MNVYSIIIGVILGKPIYPVIHSEIILSHFQKYDVILRRPVIPRTLKRTVRGTLKRTVRRTLKRTVRGTLKRTARGNLESQHVFFQKF